MNNFARIKEALIYIDRHLDERINHEFIAGLFHFSPYYFHRMFTIIVGKTITAYIRDRRLIQAWVQLSATNKPVIDIGLDCGYNSAQSFSRAFKDTYGLSPNEYRKQGFTPIVVTADELIMKFTNRLRGGAYLYPKVIKHNSLLIAGVCGEGNKTWDVWKAFEKFNNDKPITKKLSDNCYEIRLYEGDKCTVHVGFLVSDEQIEAPYTVFKLPASKYASFDVYVANGYSSENNAMNEWLETNQEGYVEKLLDGKTHYCVEYYDERFNGNETGSIVEIWVPIEKKD